MFAKSPWHPAGEAVIVEAEDNTDGVFVMTREMLRAVILGGDVPNEIEAR